SYTNAQFANADWAFFYVRKKWRVAVRVPERRPDHRQAPIRNPRSPSGLGFLLYGAENSAAEVVPASA
ncbi:hypothetical protein ACPA2M_26925, partial [Ectopseudomonas chengduensis]